jgi:hypothetical protein
MRILSVLCLVGVLSLAVWASGVRAADAPSGASCATIAFRPIAPGLADGDQTAGYYKSRIGRIEVTARVRGGKAQRYFVLLDGRLPPAVREKLPATIVACTKAKRLSPPENPDTNCLGDRLVVLIAHTPEQRYLLLYTHRANGWHFCSVGLI